MSLAQMNEIRFDKYRLLERISHGGMAEVFRAKTLGAAGFEREVAIKLLLPSVAMDSDFITMLIDEAKIAGQLSHANIAQIFDLGMAEGRYYIVQEYVKGADLRTIVRRARSLKQPLSVAQACHIMVKVCEGLEYAHNKRDTANQPLNLVHRDVSPQNILVSLDGQIKLIDFGIAKAEGRATRTLAGLVKGKFAYMSPEQIRGLPVDRRSDVFACGIVFHELLTAQPLFLRKSEFETLKRARAGDIPPPSELNPEVDPELDAIVLKALARHVDDRYQSAQALRDSIWAFTKSSGRFYSQAQLSAWMHDRFGPSDETQTAVTTERDSAPVRIDEGYTGDETGRTFDDVGRARAAASGAVDASLQHASFGSADKAPGFTPVMSADVGDATSVDIPRAALPVRASLASGSVTTPLDPDLDPTDDEPLEVLDDQAAQYLSGPPTPPRGTSQAPITGSMRPFSVGAGLPRDAPIPFSSPPSSASSQPSQGTLGGWVPAPPSSPRPPSRLESQGGPAWEPFASLDRAHELAAPTGASPILAPGTSAASSRRLYILLVGALFLVALAVSASVTLLWRSSDGANASAAPAGSAPAPARASDRGKPE